MDWFAHLWIINDKFLGIEWHFWKVVGWAGNLIFFSRFFFQWIATERSGRVVVPALFWWLSLVGSGCLLAYSFYRRDSVFIFAYLFTWIPYIRNLMIGRRATIVRPCCVACEETSEPGARYCQSCGKSLEGQRATIHE
jgi:lipid-A-disaccharide synthase-like uncharacterized protein